MILICSCQRVFSPVIRTLLLCAVLIATLPITSVVMADECPEEPPLQNYTGSGTTVCPCFVPGEQGGAVLDAPSEHYPIEILRVGIGWGSLYGGTPQSLEQAIHVYDAGLPNPGTPIASLEGPALTDGYINEFDLEPLPGDIIVNSGPFTVTLEFLNSNAGDPYAPSMVHDGNGCQAGKNVVFAIPGGWYSACALGVTGDWIVYAVYRQVECGAGVGEEMIASSHPAFLMRPEPNPFTHETRFDFVVSEHRHVDLSVYDVHGQLVTTLASGMFPQGRHTAGWTGTESDGSQVAPGIYFVTMKAGSFHTTQRVVFSK
ncbi:MAG: FlgD immunoglobulin-like domain containing protein [Candidatus Eisenbacteria bacterium]